MSRRIGALAALGLGLLTACDAVTNPEDEVRFFPLTVGNSWTYAPPDPVFGEPFRWEVTARRGDTVTLARESGPSHPGPVRLLDRVEGIDLLRNDVDAASLYRFTPGSSWVRHEPWECDDLSGWGAVEEPNPITTPAGTFPNTLRIERRTTANCTDAGTMVEWWAPGVGLVRWEELNFYAGGPLAFELVSYSVN